jgi:hypothetical protein
VAIRERLGSNDSIIRFASNETQYEGHLQLIKAALANTLQPQYQSELKVLAAMIDEKLIPDLRLRTALRTLSEIMWTFTSMPSPPSPEIMVTQWCESAM